MRSDAQWAAAALFLAACSDLPLEQPSDRDASAASDAPMPEPLAVELGKGQHSFESLIEGEVVTLEYGPQGGHHMWGAVRIEDCALGSIQLGFALDDTNGAPIFGYNTRRTATTQPALVEGIQIFVDPLRIETASVALTVEVRDADGRIGEDRRVIRLVTGR